MSQIELNGIDLLFLADVKLVIRDVVNLERTENMPAEELYEYCGHLIKSVEICGIIVAVESSSNSCRYTVDDGTDTIECVLWFNSDEMEFSKPLDLGTTVRVTGKITTVRCEKQITIFNLYPTHDPHSEVTHLLQVMQLKKLLQQQVKIPYYPLTHDREILQPLQPTYMQSEFRSLEDLVLHHLPLVDEFSFSSLRDHVELKAAVEQYVINKQCIQSSQDKIEAVILSVFQDLVRKGSVVNTSHEKGIYKRINDEHLANTIIEIVDDIQHRLPCQRCSVRVDYIITKVLERPDYKELYKSKRKIISLVNELVEQGILYITGDKEYRLLLDE
ncbi:hypothetical protein BD560DRAFT_448062 [Blakeslea trispora]|nr:hypothetical protein BD560DRAFT_448062 [Blakeslea trispora]